MDKAIIGYIVFTRAWELARQDFAAFGGTSVKNYFRAALIQSWAEFLSGGKEDKSLGKEDEVKEPETLTVGRADYQERKEARIDRLEERAGKAEKEGESRLQTARKMGDGIPFGQPMMPGHHSYKRDVSYRKRMTGNYEKGFQNLKKAEHLQDRAQSAASNTAISSDNPQALVLIEEKISELKEQREVGKKINAAWKKFLKKPESLEKADLKDSVKEMIKNYTPEYSWSKPYMDYDLSGSLQEIKRLEKRMVELKETATLKNETLFEKNGIEVYQNKDQNRIQLIFPDKPSEEIRKKVKQAGFRWAKSEKAWQRKLDSWATQRAVNLAKEIA